MIDKNLIWKIRTVKDYKEANTHIVVGEILEQTPMWVRIEGRTYHFGKLVNRVEEIREGEFGIRIIPWNRVEIANELDKDFNCKKAVLKDYGKSGVVLTDGDKECLIYRHFNAPID
jgi:translation initiation factor 1 (eIF-1/SUI1)